MKNGTPQTEQVTGLEHWFRTFADVRNTIIHEGVVPSLVYTNTLNTNYEGPFAFTAEFLLRAAIKASLAPLGYPDLWRSAIWKAVKAAFEQLEASEPSGRSRTVGESTAT